MGLSAEQKELIFVMNRRLKESAKFWYQCADEYHSLDDFLSSLNALVQSLRNITFILQSNKNLIPNFEDWYSKQVNALESDEPLKKLNDARVEVVHRGDLKLKSYAIMSLVNWENKPLLQWKIDPLEDINKVSLPPIPDEIRDLLSKKYREPLVCVERKWIVESLSDFEVLQTLSYCYRKLRTVVVDAYIQSGISILESEIEKIEKDNYLLLGEIPEDKRIAYFNLQYEKINLKKKKFKTTAESIEKAKNRYGLPKFKKIKKHLQRKDPLLDFEYYLESAKIILKKDGNHIPIAFLYSGDKNLEILPIPSNNRTELYAQIRNLAKKIKMNKNATGIVIINEMWISNAEDCLGKGIFPENDSKSEELLSIVAIRKDGFAKIAMETFNRHKGVINFDKSLEGISMESFYALKPILEAWGLTDEKIQIV